MIGKGPTVDFQLLLPTKQAVGEKKFTGKKIEAFKKRSTLNSLIRRGKIQQIGDEERKSFNQ